MPPADTGETSLGWRRSPMQLYNSLTRRKEELPAPPGPIRIYVCGPTVYQRIHIGNTRPFVLSMWLERWLEQQGYEVILVENVTDVNDRIYDAAAVQRVGSAELAAQATRWYFEDTDELGLGRPDAEPLASETIPEIITLIEELVDRELAYESGGDVYFRVARYPDYGGLSGAKLEDMVAQEPSDLKEDQRDFALWKATKPGEDTAWDSPWGRGRPGWHIECSAMAEKHLGPAFEIHGGGLDLRFPHHENELAQSRGAGREFARIWMHNGMLDLDKAKMSKSLGNIVPLRDVLDEYGPEAILVFFLGGHYRSPIDYSDDAMRSATTETERFRNAFRTPQPERAAPGWEALEAALADDFNTQAALTVLHDWRAAGQLDLLRRGLTLFGLGTLAEEESAPEEIVSLASRREEARRRSDFGEADRLREEIAAAGWEVRDNPDGFDLVPLR
jgi:cysteinyl-tRNA synthetase